MISRALLLATVMVAGCGPWLTEGDYYYVHRNGADLPVWIRGNVDSGVFIVTLHGGPGASGHEFVTSQGFRKLEHDYALVYWDQRASGMSQGNPSPETFTVEEFVADTDAVVSVTREIYGYDEFFLLGHSWGGDLGLAYMVDGEQRDRVVGFLTYGGTHDEPFAMAESRAWTMEKIEETIADGAHVAYWRKVLKQYEATPVLKSSDDWHYVYASSFGAYYADPSTYVPPNYIELALASPFSMGFYQNRTRSHRLGEALADDFDYTDRLGEITAPTLVLNGELDGIVPRSVAEAMFPLLGTPEEDKRLVVFPDIAHSCHDENPELFAETVSQFIEEYR